MQATQIKVGKEYAISGYGGVRRARCEEAPRKGIYDRHATALFRVLELRTGEATVETRNVQPREVHGLWEDHQREVLEKQRRLDQNRADERANYAEIMEILAEMGFTEKVSAPMVSASVRPEHSYVTLHLSMLRDWRERKLLLVTRAQEEQ
jgi:hypothetical protein